MKYKNYLLYFNIFILTLTIAFSNICTNFVMAETTTEPATETTTEQPSIIHNYCNPSDPLTAIHARAAILVDADTGIVLYEKNADEVLYPASITKIMTTLLGCEYGDKGKYKETVTHSTNAINGIGYGSSTMGMQIGEQISFEDCLFGIMMCSANEACMALAEHIAGSVQGFVDMMNERAKAIGCQHTHFANPHGFHDPNHYTCARDMALITREALKNKKFSEIWGTMLRTLPATNLVKEPRGLVNRAKILDDESQYYYSYVKGAKTGFHDDALNTLVAYAEKDDAKLISVVLKDLGAPLAYADTKALLEYGFGQYTDTVLYEGKNYSGTVKLVQTYNGKEYYIGTADAIIKKDFSAKVPKPFDKNNITAKAKLEDKIELPLKEGDVLGKMTFTYDGLKMGECNIVAAASAEKLSNKEMAKKELLDTIKTYTSKFGTIVAVLAAIFVVLIIIIIIIRKVVKAKRRKKKKRLQAERRNQQRKRPSYRNISSETRTTERPAQRRRPRPNTDNQSNNKPRRPRPKK